MTAIDVAAIRTRAGAAWAGRWTVRQHYDETVVSVAGSELIVCAMPDTECDRAAAEFIAHARTDIPDLLSALARVEALHRKVLAAGYCELCAVPYPCPTVAAVRGDASDDG